MYQFSIGYYSNRLIMRQRQSVTIVPSSFSLPLHLFSSSFQIYRVVTHLWLCLKHLSFFSSPPPPLSSSCFVPPSVLPLPSVFCPNWRLKREFYILAASNDERPLITVYPCRWCTAVAIWDPSISFYVFPLFLFFMFLSSLSSPVPTVYCLTWIIRVYWTAVWQALIVICCLWSGCK